MPWHRLRHSKLDRVIEGPTERPPAVCVCSATNLAMDNRSVQLLLEVGGRAARRWEGSGGGRDVSKKEFSECQPSQ